MFAQVEPITQNKLGLPPYSLLCSSSLSPPHPLISLVWVVIWKAGQIHSEHLLSNKQGSNGCLPKVQEPLCARKLNISDRQNGRRQITVALSWASDLKKADVNCYQQPYTLAIAFQKGIPNGWCKTFLFVCNYIQSEQMTLPQSHHTGCLGLTIRKYHPNFRRTSQPTLQSPHKIWTA